MKFYPGDIVECIEITSFDTDIIRPGMKVEVTIDNIDYFNNPKFNKRYKRFTTLYAKPEGF